MRLGVLSFGDLRLDSQTGLRQPVGEQLCEQLERIRLADEVGIDLYGVGEHHLDNYAVSSPGTLLAAAVSQTKRITLASAVSVLSTDDPVRVYQQFATIDQLSRGRAEIIAGRGSFTESFPLFGADLRDYDALYEEKLDLLLQIDSTNPVTWSGRFRAPLEEAHIYPRPFRDHLKMSVGTGGNPQSSARAGLLGLPIVYAVLGVEPERFGPLADLYRQAGAHRHHQHLEVTMANIGLIARRSQDAKDTFYPYWRQVMEYGATARQWTVPTRADYDDYTRNARTILAGSPAEIADRMSSVIAATGAQRYALQMDWAGVPHRNVMDAIELLGTEVAPQLAERGTPAGPMGLLETRRTAPDSGPDRV